MDVKDAVLKRKASKVYIEEEPNLDDVKIVTDAGLWAPTAGNVQSSMIIAITNKDFKVAVSKYFDKNNWDQVITCDVLFIFAGTKWVNDQYMKKMFIDNSMKYWNLPDDLVESMADGMVDYYANHNEYKDEIDVLASGTQMGMMMLQATELGYDTNGMLGFDKTKLTNYLKSKGLLNDYQAVNVAFSMGHRDEKHERNTVLTHNRIQKELLVKEIV